MADGLRLPYAELGHLRELVQLLARHAWPDWKIARKLCLGSKTVVNYRTGYRQGPEDTYRRLSCRELREKRLWYVARRGRAAASPRGSTRRRGVPWAEARIARIDAELARRKVG